MKKYRNSFIAMGIPSIFTIFAVLCLVILSLLTLQTSRADLKTSLLSMEHTSAYYEACQEAAEIALQIEDYAEEIIQTSAKETDYFYRLASVTEKLPEVSYDMTSRVFSFCVSVSEKQELYAELQAHFPDDTSNSTIKIIIWKTQTAGKWTPDTRQPVFQG